MWRFEYRNAETQLTWLRSDALLMRFRRQCEVIEVKSSINMNETSSVLENCNYYNYIREKMSFLLSLREKHSFWEFLTKPRSEATAIITGSQHPQHIDSGISLRLLALLCNPPHFLGLGPALKVWPSSDWDWFPYLGHGDESHESTRTVCRLCIISFHSV